MSAHEPLSSANLAPGSLVVVRDEEWIVTQVSHNADGQFITVQGLSELVAGTTAQFSERFDDITALDPRETALVSDQSPNYRHARLWLEATLRKTPLPIDDPSLAVVSEVLADSLDYQKTAVAKALNPETLRPRILLADTVGLGKTLEIGMILSELIRRGRGERILIVTPRHVLEQMQQEMWTRFAIPFVRLDSVGIQQVRRQLPANRNPFSRYQRAIISIDTLKSDRYLSHLRKHRWDAIVIDESHNITNSQTQNNRLARTLAATTDALILASATPHNGRKESFAEMIRLLEPTSVSPQGDIAREELERLVVRRHRHSPEVAEFVGAEWATRQEPNNVLVPASDAENMIAHELAEQWLYGENTTDVLFGWTLAKAFLSSPAALAETVKNRLHRQAARDELTPQLRMALERLEGLAQKAEAEKGGKYAALLEQFGRIGISKNSPERVVVFAERVATLEWLRGRLMKDLKMDAEQIEILHGGLSDVDQQGVVERFKQENAKVRVLITGDVASEGVNLHLQCHELIHYDIPWSLIRIEQRNGRIDRYGQRKNPLVTTLLLNPSDERFSGDIRVLTSLMTKEHEAHTALGDTASLMGQYSVKGEEDAIRAVLMHKKSLDDVVATPEQVRGGDDFDAFFASLAVTPSNEPVPVKAATGSGLYASSLDYLREAVATVYPRPDEAPRKDGGGGIGWVEHRDEQIVEMTPPADLKARLQVLPQSYLREREVTKRLRLATSATRGKTEVERARSEQTTWPAAHYLGPLHPVLDWVSDRALASLGRGEIFAVRGSCSDVTVLVLATLMNGAGQIIATSWISVVFPDVESSLGFATPHKDAAAMLADVGMNASMVNSGPLADMEALQALIPKAVDRASENFDLTTILVRDEAQRRVDEWSNRVKDWQDEAALLSQADVLQKRRASVEEEAELSKRRSPAQSYIRPLLVVVPQNYPAAVREGQ